MDLAETRACWLTCQVLQGGRGIDQAPVEEYPSRITLDSHSVGKGDLDSAARESQAVHPWQRRTLAAHLFLDNSPTGLLYRGMTALGQLGQER